MRIVPPIRPIRDGKILDTNLINHIIQRTEYGAELLSRYKMVAGSNIFVEQAGNGLGVSYLTALAGGAGTGSGGAGTGIGGEGTGTGGAGTGNGGSGNPQKNALSYNVLGAAFFSETQSYRYFVYDGIIFTDLPAVVDGLEATYLGISGSKIGGYYYRTTKLIGFIYDGSTFTEVNVPSSNSNNPRGFEGTNMFGGFSRFTTQPYYPGFISNGLSYTEVNIPSNAIENVSSTQIDYMDGDNALGIYIYTIGADFRNRAGCFTFSGGSISKIPDPPGASYGSRPIAMSGSNIIVNTQVQGGVPDLSYLYNGSSHKNIQYPGSYITRLSDIDGSTIIGNYRISGAQSPAGGFIYDGSTFTNLLFNNMPAFPRIIKHGHIVGNYQNNRGFYYNGSTFTDIFYPGSASTVAYDIA